MLLLDTHLLLGSGLRPERLSSAARALVEDPLNEQTFSPAGVGRWSSSAPSAVRIDPQRLRRSMVNNGYVELAVTSDHALAVDMLPHLHKNPFDRPLIAEAVAEGLPFTTTDAQRPAYLGDIRLV